MAMLPDSAPVLRSTLEALRAVFLGVASRHDGMHCRWVIAEQGYNEHLGGPNDADWRHDKLIQVSPFTLRSPAPCRVTPEQREQILEQRPDARFGTFEGGNELLYLPPGINSDFLMRGSMGARDQFAAPARDAGFCLLRLLQMRKLSIKLPELIPYEAIARVQSRSASTNLPSDLNHRWLAFLHILGWQNLPFCPLRANRSIWHQNTSILGDPEELHKALESPVLQKMREHVSLPARYFASTMQTDVNLASVYAIDAILSGMIDLPTIDVEQLAKSMAALQPGGDDASAFHSLVQHLLTVIFEPDLHSPVSEEKIHEGRGRIDLVFTNAAERGYFADLPFRHDIKCPVVFFECKNYSTDIKGPEFAQLTSRFSEKRSNVGFIVCRAIEDKVSVEKRCRDRYQDKHEHILVLEDADLVEMLKLKSEGTPDAISRYLHAKFRPIFMDA